MGFHPDRTCLPAVCLSLVSVALLPTASEAAETYVIGTPVTDQNGGYSIHDEDTVTITETGSVTREGRFQHAFYASNAEGFTLINDGLVETTDDNANGVLFVFGHGTTITNNGDFLIRGGQATAIKATHSDDVAIINNGTITATGTSSNTGIYGNNSDRMSVVNNGVILTYGEESSGVYISDSVGAQVENTGSITVTGDNSYALSMVNVTGGLQSNRGDLVVGGAQGIGMYALKAAEPTVDSMGATIINTGSILVTGENGRGIRVARSDGAVIVNSGTIRTTGAGQSEAIRINGSTGVKLINSGSVISEQGAAIKVDEDSTAELTLLTSGYIGGKIILEGDVTVNVVAEAGQSVLWDLSSYDMSADGMSRSAPTSASISILGDGAGFFSETTGQFATYDPSAFAGTVDMLGDMAGLLGEVGRKHSARPGFWIDGFGASLTHDGDGTATLGRDIDQWGTAMGFSGENDAGLLWSAMGGVLGGQIDVSGAYAQSYDIETKGWFMGMNGHRDLGNLVLDFGLTTGRIAYDQSRFVNDNLAETEGAPLGESWAQARYSGWFVMPQVGLSASLGRLGGWDLTGSGRLSYAAQWVQGYGESGSEADARVGAHMIGVLEGGLELAAQRQVGMATISTRLGYLARHSAGDDSATVTLIGETQGVGFGDPGRGAAYAGIGLDLPVGDWGMLRFDVAGYSGDGVSGAQAQGLFTVAF